LSRLPLILLICAAWLAVAAAPARADLFGPDDSVATAQGPLLGGTNYDGRLKSGSDLDHLFFYVARPGVTLRFTVTNTLRSCSPAGENYCPLWATLLDTSARQLGGEGSGAGTGQVTFGESQDITWTFLQTGKHIIVLEGQGDLVSYRLRIDPANGLSATPPPFARLLPLVRSLRFPLPQRGIVVRGRMGLRRVARRTEVVLTARASRGRPAFRAGGSVRRNLGPGTVDLRAPLSATGRAALRRRGTLPLTVTVNVTGRDGTHTRLVRRFTLTR
jgi:hypothetical protein